MVSRLDAFRARIQEVHKISGQQITPDDILGAEVRLRTAPRDTAPRGTSDDFLKNLRTRLPLNLSDKYSS
ncbi:MAG TPA: hypothetical protein VEW42_02020 [Candidatus Eisenbacteria bacterium]|nr:hypothetical protein [Candidatus Eisenbacteria bacterium]